MSNYFERKDAINSADNNLEIRSGENRLFVLIDTATNETVARAMTLAGIVDHAERTPREPNRADKAASIASGLPAFFYYVQRSYSQRHAETWLRQYRIAQARIQPTP